MTVDDEGLTMSHQTRAAVLSEMGAARPYADSRPLVVQAVALEPPGRGEVQVAIRAAGLCHSDLSVINGDRPRPLPMALGHEAAGVVEAVGANVRTRKVGDRVAYCMVRGSYAEAQNLPAWQAVKLPANVSDETAAAAMLKGLTARYLLKATHPVKKGQTIVLHSAAGGVGLIAYSRKEGRALGEVTKFLVYNARKRQVGGDSADKFFLRTEWVAGVQDMRFQELMPDVFHWLGISRIDRFASMSNMKSDALREQGIDIVEQVPIPDELIPADAHEWIPSLPRRPGTAAGHRCFPVSRRVSCLQEPRHSPTPGLPCRTRSRSWRRSSSRAWSSPASSVRAS